GSRPSRSRTREVIGHRSCIAHRNSRTATRRADGSRWLDASTNDCRDYTAAQNLRAGFRQTIRVSWRRDAGGGPQEWRIEVRDSETNRPEGTRTEDSGVPPTRFAKSDHRLAARSHAGGPLLGAPRSVGFRRLWRGRWLCEPAG